MASLESGASCVKRLLGFQKRQGRSTPFAFKLPFPHAFRTVEVDTIAHRREESMSKVRVAAFSVSLDGFGAGPLQDLENPLGVRGLELHGWVFTTDAFKKMHGQGEGTKGIDNDVAEQSFENVGAWILGRNMFGPVRGPWNDRPGDSWKGWWGDNPPYHTPVFVLTHHPRPALAMEGGTTFHFVTDGAESALNKAREAARGKRRTNRRWSIYHPSISHRRGDRRSAPGRVAGVIG